MEKPSTLESTEVLDARWYSRFESLAFSTFEYLDGSAERRASEKDKFLSGESVNPTLDYPKLEKFNFETREKDLLELKNEIIENEPNETVVEIYRTKINEQLAELRLLLAAKNGDDRRFSRYSRFVYGVPDSGNTAYATTIVADKVLSREGLTEEDKMRFEMLKSEVGEYDEVEIEVPASAIKGRVGSLDEVIEVFKEALGEVGADDWKVVQANNSSISNFRVSQAKKEITVPDNKGDMFKRRLNAFVQHEVFGHVKRRVNGEVSRLKLLGLGLDRVEKGEEGVATYLEQNVTGATEPVHAERYFAIALASGEVDGVPRDFRQTYDVLFDYYKNTLKVGDDIEDRAKEAAWKLTVRVFRGTTGDTPGAVYNKDLAYFEGNKETWAAVNSNENIVKYFSIGKFDAANSRHINWLVKLGITDADLAEITKNTAK